LATAGSRIGIGVQAGTSSKVLLPWQQVCAACHNSLHAAGWTCQLTQQQATAPQQHRLPLKWS